MGAFSLLRGVALPVCNAPTSRPEPLRTRHRAFMSWTPRRGRRATASRHPDLYDPTQFREGWLRRLLAGTIHQRLEWAPRHGWWRQVSAAPVSTAQLEAFRGKA